MRSTDPARHTDSLARPMAELLVPMIHHITTLNLSITTSSSSRGHWWYHLQFRHPLARQPASINHWSSKERRSGIMKLPLQHPTKAWRTNVIINGGMQRSNRNYSGPYPPLFQTDYMTCKGFNRLSRNCWWALGWNQPPWNRIITTKD